MKKRFTLLPVLLALLLALAACGGDSPTAAPTTAPTDAPAADQGQRAVTNAVSVADQALGEGNTVTIESVTADVAGWLVIHTQADGRPGPVLGFAPVAAGQNSNVVVEIDPAGATPTLYAMLHIDAGTAGTYEFPGEDGPATDAAGNVVTPPFNLTGDLPAAATLNLAESADLGPYLAGPNGMTLYTFDNDTGGTSTCYDACATNWPPLLVDDAAGLSAAAGVTGELGTSERTDGTLQVTYNGRPLYYWANDQAPGDTTGHGVNGVWFVAVP